MTKALQGAAMIGPKTHNVLQPITGVILHRLLRAIPFAASLRKHQMLYSALILISHHACMQQAEVVHLGTSSHTLQVIQISEVEGKELQISFLSYKLNRNGIENTSWAVLSCGCLAGFLEN